VRSANSCSPVTVVILAAGRSRRFGSDKLLRRLADGDTLLQRAIRARGDFDAVVVASPPLRDLAVATRVCVIVNGEPERGMAHSLRLADARIDRAHAIAVLPADLLLIEPRHLASVAGAAAGVDVTHPASSGGVPGHPVVFSARARGLIAQLADREPIATIRDRADLTRRVIRIDEDWPYRDVDTPGDLGQE